MLFWNANNCIIPNCVFICLVSSRSYSPASEEPDYQSWQSWCHSGRLQCRYFGISYCWGKLLTFAIHFKVENRYICLMHSSKVQSSPGSSNFPPFFRVAFSRLTIMPLYLLLILIHLLSSACHHRLLNAVVMIENNGRPALWRANDSVFLLGARIGGKRFQGLEGKTYHSAPFATCHSWWWRIGQPYQSYHCWRRYIFLFTIEFNWILFFTHIISL